MSTTVIKGSDLLPEIIARLHLNPEKVYEIRERREYEEEDMPPEEMIREEIIAEVEKSSQDYREGKGTDYKNMAELKDAMSKWMSDDA
ncbi:MAG: hypothetical protein HZA01_06070 [Nitrospinae bacterium]|nr:hypothetical protein [Nitrospinota bacterium]